jgi:hypothetical protein
MNRNESRSTGCRNVPIEKIRRNLLFTVKKLDNYVRKHWNVGRVISICQMHLSTKTTWNQSNLTKKKKPRRASSTSPKGGGSYNSGVLIMKHETDVGSMTKDDHADSHRFFKVCNDKGGFHSFLCPLACHYRKQQQSEYLVRALDRFRGHIHHTYAIPQQG